MRRVILEFFESVRIAVTQIRANKMRSGLTALGVVIGIVAVTLMVTVLVLVVVVIIVIIIVDHDDHSCQEAVATFP